MFSFPSLLTIARSGRRNYAKSVSQEGQVVPLIDFKPFLEGSEKGKREVAEQIGEENDDDDGKEKKHKTIFKKKCSWESTFLKKLYSSL